MLEKAMEIQWKMVENGGNHDKNPGKNTHNYIFVGLKKSYDGFLENGVWRKRTRKELDKVRKNFEQPMKDSGFIMLKLHEIAIYWNL